MSETRPNAATDQAELERLRAAVMCSGDLAYEWDLTDNSIIWLGRTGELFGLKDADKITTGDAFYRRLHPDDLLIRRRVLGQHIEESKPFDCEYRIRTDTGEFRWVHERGSVRLSPQGEPVSMAGTLRDVTALKQNVARLEFKANYDELTGHFNRARLRDTLDQAIAFASRYRVGGAYLVIGLEKLTKFADAFGYETTDAIILAVGQRLERNLRASDTIGRAGGDSFGVILANCPEGHLETVAKKILDVVQSTAVSTPSGPIHATVSVGGAAFPDGPNRAHDIMARAELALQEARDAGRNCFQRYNHSEAQRRDRRENVEVAERVQEALKDGRLVLAYQPIVAAGSHEVSHYECLLRMIGPDGKVHTAASFMPVIEEMGLVRQVDQHVIELAVKELVEYPEVHLAVNVSGLTACDRSWLRLLVALVKSGRGIAERLTVEITETVALQDIDESAHFVTAVRELGSRVALDDFGAGYTSFRNLKALAVDVVKIDGSFVRNVSENLDNQLFVKTLLGLANGFSLTTVAECVETAEDAATLARHGVDYLQGYYFGRPQIERPWLARKSALSLPTAEIMRLPPVVEG